MMKTFSTLFALSAMGADAFQAPKAPATTSNTALFSTVMRRGESLVGGLPSRVASTNAIRRTGTAAIEDIWDTEAAVIVQGGSLRTWSFQDARVETVQVFMKTEGRPLNANVELWQGPDNTPQKMGVYCEDASLRPFSAVMQTPRDSNAVAIRNTGHLEFPLIASVEADVNDAFGFESDITVQRTIQGGAIVTYPFDQSVRAVAVWLKTDGRPLNARIELMQGPNNNKQVMEVYTEDGLERPFFCVIETPGTGNVVRIINTATVEFPIFGSVEPYIAE